MINKPPAESGVIVAADPPSVVDIDDNIDFLVMLQQLVDLIGLSATGRRLPNRAAPPTV